MNLRDVDEAVIAEVMGRGWDRWHGWWTWTRLRLRWSCTGHGFAWRADLHLSYATMFVCMARSERLHRVSGRAWEAHAARLLAMAGASRRAAAGMRRMAAEHPHLA